MDTIEGFRLSAVQRLMWTIGERDGHGVIQARLALTAPLDTDRLAAALAVLADRHEALRIRPVEHAGLRVPLQVVDDRRPVPLTEHETASPADRVADPLRATLTGTELVLTGSPLSVDPASLELLVGELAVLYGGGALPDDDERPQLLDVSEWQHEQAARATNATANQAAVRQVELPFRLAGTTGGTVGRHVVEMTGAGLAGLCDAAARRRCQPQDLLLTAWLLALGPFCGTTGTAGSDSAELALAWYDDGRSVAGVREVIGPLGSHVPLRVAVSRIPAEQAEAVTTALTEARGRSLLTEPVDDSAPLAAGFAYTAEPDRAALGSLLPIAELTVDGPSRVGPVHLGCVDGADRLRITLTFDSARHDPDVCCRLLDSVAVVLASLPSALDQPEQLRTLGAAEAALLSDWSGERSDYPVGTLVDALDAGITGAEQDADAVIAADGTVSFGELDRAASAVASRLVRAGIAPGEPVAVLAGRSWRTVVAFVGILRAGAAYVPLDPSAPLTRLVELTTRVGAATVVGGPDGPLAELAGQLRTLVVERNGDAPSWDRVAVMPDQAAYVIFTSGSTGTPRPVVVEHGSAHHLWHALADGADPIYPVRGNQSERLRVAINAPFTFDASIKQLVQLASGHTLCLIPEEIRHDGRALLAYLAGLSCDVLDCTPAHLRAVLEARQAGDRLPATVLVGGEAIDAELWRELAGLDGVRAVNLYGPTECTVDVSAADITAGTEPTIGRPLPGTRVWVLDDDLRPVPAGAAGELCVSGPQLARGYQGDEQATAARFVTATVAGGTSERLYRTGDVVRFERDGRIRYLGRTDDQVKINGYRVEPGEVAAVLRQHPALAQAVVVAAPGPDTADRPRLVGYAVAATDAAGAVRPDRLAGINQHETRYLYDEIFLRQVYLRGGITMHDDAVVLDVGANIGMFSLFARALWPSARLYAFEPLALAFEKLQHNLAGHLEQVTLLPFGLSESEREETFAFYPGYSMMSGQHTYADPVAELRVVKRFLANERDQGLAGRDELLRDADDLLADRFRVVEQRCRLRRLSDVIDEQGIDHIDLIKIDVQRAELDVLRGLDDRHWPKVSQVAMEVHDEPGTPTEGRLAVLRELFDQHGFRVVVEQDELMSGTGRYSLAAVRPDYQRDPRLTVPVAVPGGPVAGTAVDGPALRDWLAQRLPAHLVPDAVVLLDELPLTPNGKVDRDALPAPDTAAGAGVSAASGAEPDNPAEQVLLDVWREVLGRTDFGVEDKFFQFGGDSIRAIRVRAAAAKRGLTFPLRNVIRYQTIRELVAESGLTAAGDGGTGEHGGHHQAFAMIGEPDRAILPDGLDDAYPLTALQLGMIYHSELSAARAGYHVVTVHRIRAPLAAEAFRTALADTVAAHPVLRTSFALGRFREPLQLVHRRVDVPLKVDDVCSFDSDRRQARLDEIVATERSTPFDWNRAPLLRFRVVHTSEDTFELVMSHFHGILDGWSLHLLLREVCTRYHALRIGAVAGDQHPAMPYRRFVELERAARADEDSAEFWRARLTGATPLIVASGHAGERDQMARTTAQHVEPLPVDLARTLDRIAAERAVPLKSLLLATHLRVLGEHTGRDDVLSGLVVSGRPGEQGADRTLGLFLNTVPIRLTIGTDSLAALANRLWRAEQDLAGQHTMPLADIERLAGRGRLFDTLFNFTNFGELSGSSGKWSRVDVDQDTPTDIAFGLAVDFQVLPATGGLELTLQYDDRHLMAEDVRSMAARYRQLLFSLAGDSGQTALPPVAVPGEQATWSGRVAAIWQELTGLEPASGDADFTTSGGSSLLAVRFVSMLRDRYGVAVDLLDIRRDGRFDSVVGLAVGATARERTT